MALGEIPPWLNVSPSLFLQATEAGNRARLGGAELEERQRESLANEANQSARLGLQRLSMNKDLGLAEQREGFNEDLSNRKLAMSQQETDADRELKRELALNAQNVAQKRFDIQTGIQQASLDLRRSQDMFQNSLKTLAVDRMAKAKDAEAEILQDYDPDKPLSPMLADHPEAMADKEFLTFARNHDAQLDLNNRQKALLGFREQPKRTQVIDPFTGKVQEERITETLSPDQLKSSPKQNSGYKTAEDVRKAYKAGTITRDEAKKILGDQFGIQ